MAVRVEPLIKMLLSLSLVKNADCLHDSTALLELSLTTKPHQDRERLPSREIIGNNIQHGGAKTVCKHFSTLITSNISTNAKLIYLTCIRNKKKFFLPNTCFSVSVTFEESHHHGAGL